MDPISIAVSAASLLGVAAQVARILYKVEPESTLKRLDIQWLAYELSQLRVALQNLGLIAATCGFPVILPKLGSTLMQCKSSLQYLYESLSSEDARSYQDPAQQLWTFEDRKVGIGCTVKWPFSKQETGGMALDLKDCHTTLKR